MRRSTILIGLVLILGLALGRVCYGQFDDAPQVNSWVYESFLKVYNAGLIKGYPDGTFRGGRPATRNEVVEFMARLMDYFDAKLAGQQPLQPVQTDEKKPLSEEDVKALIRQALSEQDTSALATQEDLIALSDDVFKAIQDLETTLKADLDALDVRVTTLEKAVSEIKVKDSQQDATITKLQADLEAAKAQAAQDKAAAAEETKKAKTLGLVGAILAVLGLLVGI